MTYPGLHQLQASCAFFGEGLAAATLHWDHRPAERLVWDAARRRYQDTAGALTLTPTKVHVTNSEPAADVLPQIRAEFAGLAEHLRCPPEPLAAGALSRHASDIVAAAWRLMRLADDLSALMDMPGQRPPIRVTEVDAARLLAYAVLYPLLTLKVITAIHFQAFRLWLKRIPFHRKHVSPGDQRGVLNARNPVHHQQR